MLEIPITDARDDLAAVVNRVAFGHERILLTRRGRKLAAIIPAEELALLEAPAARPGSPTAGDKPLTASSLLRSGVCGMWSSRSDIADSAEFARRLRARARRRRRD